jgi:hypothetical protein
MREEGGIAIPSVQLIFFGTGGLFIAHTLVTGGVAQGRFMASYPTYFDLAWKLGIQLALSVLFVGAFWALMWLGAGLFGLIKLDFFEKLLGKEWFAIPVLAVAVGGALHLTDIRPVLVQGARTLLLTLLSWLLPLITLIVAGFMVSLPFTGLAALWNIGHATALLLAASAALIVLINAAHQDGAEERMPPKILRLAGSVAAVLTVPLSVIAAYALYLRVQQYGWTVDRVTVAAILIVALAYAGGYAHAALTRGRWLARIEAWNFRVALLALGLMIVMFTPLASPLRISVNDQMARLESGKVTPQKFDYAYLRDHGGRYGRAALQKLSLSKDLIIKGRVARALMKESAQTDLKNWAVGIAVFPKGEKLPKGFIESRSGGLPERHHGPVPLCQSHDIPCDAVVVDLDNNGQKDVLLLDERGTRIEIYHQEDGKWREGGSMHLPVGCVPFVLESLRRGRYRAVSPQRPWPDIEIDGVRLAIDARLDNSCEKAN